MAKIKLEEKKKRQSKNSESSRAEAFKKAYPGVECPGRLTKDAFRTLKKKHDGTRKKT